MLQPTAPLNGPGGRGRASNDGICCGSVNNFHITVHQVVITPFHCCVDLPVLNVPARSGECDGMM